MQPGPAASTESSPVLTTPRAHPRRAAGPSTVITEVEVDTETSDGSYADAVIESEWEGPRLGSCAAGDVAPMETPLVLQVATRLVSS